MDLNFIVDILVTILILPIQVILIPVDAVLAQIPGISVVPSSLNGFASFVGSIPQTVVSITGIHPQLWNMFFLSFILFISVMPSINMIKKVWAWVRP